MTEISSETAWGTRILEGLGTYGVTTMCGEVSSVQKWMKSQMWFWLERQSSEKFHSLLHCFFFPVR